MTAASDPPTTWVASTGGWVAGNFTQACHRTNLPFARRGPDTSRAPCSSEAGTEKKNGRPFVRWPELRPDKSGPAHTRPALPARSPTEAQWPKHRRVGRCEWQFGNKPGCVGGWDLDVCMCVCVCVCVCVSRRTGPTPRGRGRPPTSHMPSHLLRPPTRVRWKVTSGDTPRGRTMTSASPARMWLAAARKQ
jgi:hypothetical protein